MFQGIALVILFLANTSMGQAAELLEDRNSRFAASVADGWTCKDEGESARSKVVCYSPSGRETYVRFLVAASPGTSPNSFANEQKEKIPSLRQRVPGSTWSVTVETFGDNSVIYLTSNVGLEVASLINDGWVYNLNYQYSDPSKGARHRNEFNDIVASVVPLAGTAKTSDFTEGFVERQRRLTELYLKAGKTNKARIALLDGLREKDDDPILLDLKTKIEELD